MLLAIDVGNSNIVFGVFYGNDIIAEMRIYTDINKTGDEFALIISSFLNQKGLDVKQITGIIISSVVPSILNQLKEMSIRWFREKAVVVSSDLNLGIKILYDNPKELGADRIANAIAGYSEYAGPLIIVDFGTATTFDVVSEFGEFLGGAIAPGIGISISALSAKTALLPKIDLKKPSIVIGKNTLECMQSGCYFGLLGQVEEIIRQIKAELTKEPKVIATGGLANIIAKESKLFDEIDLDLTLKGLRIIYDRVILDKYR
ncbi:MAG: type III pantothenate kinase [Candidatus Poribacteria bacterium]